MGGKHRLTLHSEICLLDSTAHKIKLVYFCRLNSVLFDWAEYSAVPETVHEAKQKYSTSQQVAGEPGGTLCSHQHRFLLRKITAQAENKCAFLGRRCDPYSW